MSDYKLIALDMDGTLLNDEHEISKENQDAIEAARQQGVHVVLASGRPLEGMAQHVEKLKMNTKDDYILCYNGSLVQNLATGEEICCYFLTGKDAKRIAQSAEELGVHIHAFSPKRGLITPENSTYTKVEAELNGIDVHLIDFKELKDDEPIIKVMMINPPEILGKAVDKLDKQYYKDFTVVRSTPHFLEFMNKEVNKGNGVSALAEHLGLTASQVICMGDAENDHHMIKYAGLGVAMENATDETKVISNFVTESNQNHGVAKVIYDFVLNK